MGLFRKPSAAAAGVPSLDLLEEAVHLLRRAPASCLGALFFGSVPFVLALLYFWSDMARGALAGTRLMPAALGVAAAHVWMRVWQTRGCAELAACLHGRESPAWRLADWAATTGVHLRWSTWTLLGLPIAMLIMVPYGWLEAFYQGLTAVDAAPSERAVRARSSAALWPLQNHLVLAWTHALRIVAFANILFVIRVVPVLASTLLGIESDATAYPLWFLNSTVLCIVLGLAYLLVDPLVKAAYVLRDFYGTSRRTGADLLSSWHAEHREPAGTRPRAGRPALLAVVAVMSLALPAARATPEPAPPPPATVEAEALGTAIENVLARPQFAWRMPRAKAAPDHTTWLERQLNRLAAWGARCRQVFENALRRFAEWLGRLLPPSSRTRQQERAHDPQRLAWAVVFVIGLLAILGGLLVWRARRRRAPLPQADVVALVVPDVADESVTAELLPEHEWLAAAEKLRAQADYRKALRAYFLAVLSRLASLGHIRLQRAKSNRDYLLELGRRILGRPEATRRFAHTIAVFERGWYGEHPVTEHDLDQLREAAQTLP